MPPASTSASKQGALALGRKSSNATVKARNRQASEPIDVSCAEPGVSGGIGGEACFSENLQIGGASSSTCTAAPAPLVASECREATGSKAGGTTSRPGLRSRHFATPARASEADFSAPTPPKKASSAVARSAALDADAVLGQHNQLRVSQLTCPGREGMDSPESLATTPSLQDHRLSEQQQRRQQGQGQGQGQCQSQAQRREQADVCNSIDVLACQEAEAKESDGSEVTNHKKDAASTTEDDADATMAATFAGKPASPLLAPVPVPLSLPPSEIWNFPFSQDSFPWGPRNMFTSSCTMNALLFLASASAADPSSAALTSTLPDWFVEFILSNGRDCMWEWAQKVMMMDSQGRSSVYTGEMYYARPDEVAGQLINHPDLLSAGFHPIRFLFADATMSEMCEHEKLDVVLRKIREDLVAHPDTVGYVLCVDGKTSAVVTSPRGSAAAADHKVLHFDSHRRVIHRSYGAERCQAVVCDVEHLDEVLLHEMLRRSHDGNGAYGENCAGGAWKFVSTSSLEDRRKRQRPAWLPTVPPPSRLKAPPAAQSERRVSSSGRLPPQPLLAAAETLAKKEATSALPAAASTAVAIRSCGSGSNGIANGQQSSTATSKSPSREFQRSLNTRVDNLSADLEECSRLEKSAGTTNPFSADLEELGFLPRRTNGKCSRQESPGRQTNDVFNVSPVRRERPDRLEEMAPSNASSPRHCAGELTRQLMQERYKQQLQQAPPPHQQQPLKNPDQQQQQQQNQLQQQRHQQQQQHEKRTTAAKPVAASTLLSEGQGRAATAAALVAGKQQQEQQQQDQQHQQQQKQPHQQQEPQQQQHQQQAQQRQQQQQTQQQRCQQQQPQQQPQPQLPQRRQHENRQFEAASGDADHLQSQATAAAAACREGAAATSSSVGSGGGRAVEAAQQQQDMELEQECELSPAAPAAAAVASSTGTTSVSYDGSSAGAVVQKASIPDPGVGIDQTCCMARLWDKAKHAYRQCARPKMKSQEVCPSHSKHAEHGYMFEEAPPPPCIPQQRSLLESFNRSNVNNNMPRSKRQSLSEQPSDAAAVSFAPSAQESGSMLKRRRVMNEEKMEEAYGANQFTVEGYEARYDSQQDSWIVTRPGSMEMMTFPLDRKLQHGEAKVQAQMQAVMAVSGKGAATSAGTVSKGGEIESSTTAASESATSSALEVDDKRPVPAPATSNGASSSRKDTSATVTATACTIASTETLVDSDDSGPEKAPLRRSSLMRRKVMRRGSSSSIAAAGRESVDGAAVGTERA